MGPNGPINGYFVLTFWSTFWYFHRIFRHNLLIAANSYSTISQLSVEKHIDSQLIVQTLAESQLLVNPIHTLLLGRFVQIKQIHELSKP